MRPRYESQADRQNEENFIQRLKTFMGWTDVKKLPVSYHIDRMAFQGSDVALLEYKRRSLSTEKHFTFSISLLKIRVGVGFAEVMKCPFWLAIEFDDKKFGIMNVMDQTKGLLKVEWGGRTDRNDPADLEPMVRFNISDMIVHPLSVLEKPKQTETNGDERSVTETPEEDVY